MSACLMTIIKMLIEYLHWLVSTLWSIHHLISNSAETNNPTAVYTWQRFTCLDGRRSEHVCISCLSVLICPGAWVTWRSADWPCDDMEWSLTVRPALELQPLAGSDGTNVRLIQIYMKSTRKRHHLFHILIWKKHEDSRGFWGKTDQLLLYKLEEDQECD